jgi:hypothetical protein
MPKYVMAVGISGTRNGQDWPRIGEAPPADLTGAELAHMVEINHIREVPVELAEPAPVVEISKPVAPEVRARARRTRSGS